MENLTQLEQQRYERASQRVKKIAGFYRHLLVYILVNLFLISLKYFNLDKGDQFFEFSTFSTAFFWGIGLAFHALGVFGTSAFLGNNWEERKIREIMDKEKNSKWE
ncbi:histidine kinase [Flavobacterium sp. NST-5]|uniref:Histidine kinase n=1 Tax=Flavobacterium ichthyis TaxID=2698827 RepID=A0ABW9ZDV5_9FLAO|nr:2TM domain-containing protein [Flavobacterium ichthyis]NBL65280.1 histidine kinase [Flavobacterium ichthyis]